MVDITNPNCPIPNNINPLSPTGFQLAITKLPEVSFFCQSVNLPVIDLQNINVATPFSMNKQPGELLGFQDLTINFIIDEKMSNYKAIWNWLIGLGFPQDYTQYQALVAASSTSTTSTSGPAPIVPAFGALQGNFSDGTLQILGGNNTPVQSIYFADLHPVSIGGLDFQSNVDDVQYLIGSATFGYTYYAFE
jgi:hypothetical protein